MGDHRSRISSRRAPITGRAILRPRFLCGALLALAAAVALPLSAAAASATTAAASATETTRPFRDSIMPASGFRFFSTSENYWGGTVTASTGERLTVRISDSYPQDPAVAQRWADFLASLLHGSELQAVVTYLAPLREVQAVCGRSALACYSPSQQFLIAPGERVAPDISAEAIVMHEYGHHVAASRSDDPWAAVDYGTKRWSSYLQVCARVRAGQLFPGDEGSNYRLNPGEAFAETYRVLNERRLGMVESTWDVVSDSLYPDATALALVEQDVTTPWTGNVASSSTTKLTTRARASTVAVSTPLDGTLRVSVRGTKGARVTLDLLSATGSRILRTVVTGATTKTLSTTVCGTRSYRARLTLQRGSGSFRLAVSKP
jgi:hypothetical protein